MNFVTPVLEHKPQTIKKILSKVKINGIRISTFYLKS
jgi:hypothetical protein